MQCAKPSSAQLEGKVAKIFEAPLAPSVLRGCLTCTTYFKSMKNEAYVINAFDALTFYTYGHMNATLRDVNVTPRYDTIRA